MGAFGFARAGISGGSILSSTGSTWDLYNTADEVTNFERLRVLWSTNVLLFQSQNGGTGTVREMRLGNTSNFIRIFPSTNSTQFELQGASSSVVSANGLFRIGMSTTASSGITITSQVASVINQSATAGYTALDVSVTETTTGSGVKKLIDTRVGGVTLFSLLNNGRVQYVAANTASTVGAAGGASALPATPTGYLLIDIGGTAFKVPYYAN